MILTIMEVISASAMAWLCRVAEFGKKLVIGLGFRVDVNVEEVLDGVLVLADVEAAIGVVLGVVDVEEALVELGLVLALNACF